jgi:hypothetical protein
MANASMKDSVPRHQYTVFDVGKAEDAVTVRSSEDNFVDEKRAGVQWKTGVKARFPWLGFGAIVVMLIGVAGTGIILGTSNGKAREQWPGMITPATS